MGAKWAKPMSGRRSLRTWMPVDSAGLRHNTGRRRGWRRNRSRSRVEHTSGCKAVTVGPCGTPDGPASAGTKARPYPREPIPLASRGEERGVLASEGPFSRHRAGHQPGDASRGRRPARAAVDLVDRVREEHVVPCLTVFAVSPAVLRSHGSRASRSARDRLAAG